MLEKQLRSFDKRLGISTKTKFQSLKHMLDSVIHDHKLHLICQKNALTCGIFISKANPLCRCSQWVGLKLGGWVYLLIFLVGPPISKLFKANFTTVAAFHGHQKFRLSFSFSFFFFEGIKVQTVKLKFFFLSFSLSKTDFP